LGVSRLKVVRVSIRRVSKHRILVVDDEPINQQVLVNHLGPDQFNIHLVSSGERALEILEQYPFDLVLLDVMMPKMTGFEVCKKIREKFPLNELPVIFITSKNQVMDMVEGLSYGANDYISKPFSKDEFLARVNTHLYLHKINDSYSRFVPHEFLRTLRRESILDVELGDQIEQNVTILFSDIRSYTSLAESMTPKENFNFLNSYLKEVGPAIRLNKGFICNYFGDGFMALFLENSQDAVEASVSMLHKLEKFNDEVHGHGYGRIKIGIGLHTGSLILGILGDEERMDVSVVADSVNIASRMEGLTKFYGASLIVSEATLEEISNRDQFLHRFLGRVMLKGKTEKINVFEIFEGDLSTTMDLKKKTKNDFESGLNKYLEKEFTQAATLFEMVIAINPDDKAANHYLKKSARYMVEGVDENWDGAEAMEFK